MDLTKFDTSDVVSVSDEWTDETHRHLHRAWQEAAMASRAQSLIAQTAHAAMSVSHLAMAQAAAAAAVMTAPHSARCGSLTAVSSALRLQHPADAASGDSYPD